MSLPKGFNYFFLGGWGGRVKLILKTLNGEKGNWLGCNLYFLLSHN